ncbi:MAG: glycosyltransferase [Candidatus Omnitrophica bacterium]|nr:glycosyltransferase [Candidatus Omnitrophota bacterium]
MRICYFPGRESAYSRTRVLKRAMRSAGIDLLDCSVPRKDISRYFIGFLRFLRNAWKCDLVLVGFMGHFLMPIVRLFTRKPVVFDAFVSVYQTMVSDRRTFREGGLFASLAMSTDRLACRLADKVIVDTCAHAEYFSRVIGVDSEKLLRIPASADDSVMTPGPGRPEDRQFVVHFHGEFQRLHGAEHIISAAELVPEARFRLIGRGCTLEACERAATEKRLENVEFMESVTYEELARLIRESDVCLGIFGDTEKARLVIPNKVYEALASAKAVITADTPAAREILEHRVNAMLCPIADPAGIAACIRELINDSALRKKIAGSGERTFRERCSPAVIGKELERSLSSFLSRD